MLLRLLHSFSTRFHSIHSAAHTNGIAIESQFMIIALNIVCIVDLSMLSLRRGPAETLGVPVGAVIFACFTHPDELRSDSNEIGSKHPLELLASRPIPFQSKFLEYFLSELSVIQVSRQP